MSVVFGDSVDALVMQVCCQEIAAGFSLDFRYLDFGPCPICGLPPARRDPYPGVEIGTYRDYENGLSTLFWACKDCLAEARAGKIPVGTVRSRIKEWAV